MLATKIEQKKNEEGFTLIELLVVVIIIGILAAIAIPTFLNQRERGWQAELTSAVRNAALDVEAVATQAAGAYPNAAPASFVGFFERQGDDMTPTYTQTGAPLGTAFTICATHPQITGAHSVTYDSAAGGLRAFANAGC